MNHDFPQRRNDLLLRAPTCEETERVPVWEMGQAGRSLPGEARAFLADRGRVLSASFTVTAKGDLERFFVLVATSKHTSERLICTMLLPKSQRQVSLHIHHLRRLYSVEMSCLPHEGGFDSGFDPISADNLPASPLLQLPFENHVLYHNLINYSTYLHFLCIHQPLLEWQSGQIYTSRASLQFLDYVEDILGTVIFHPQNLTTILQSTVHTIPLVAIAQTEFVQLRSLLGLPQETSRQEE
ncbi:hypothetical protein BU17DRAFT_101809 [Hysterangium stoloniferum]|nr:hypothetical protein BU17DRAFT_101809 [Hysterangium stoloniferum]